MSQHDVPSLEKRVIQLEEALVAQARQLESLKLAVSKAGQQSNVQPPASSSNMIYLARVTTPISSVLGTGDTAGTGQVKILQDSAGVAVNPAYALQDVDNFIGDGTVGTTIPLKTNVFVAKIDGRFVVIGGNCVATSNP